MDACILANFSRLVVCPAFKSDFSKSRYIHDLTPIIFPPKLYVNIS